ncbi:hypothetical protein Tco_0695019 [Tanacetum coccineum]
MELRQQYLSVKMRLLGSVYEDRNDDRHRLRMEERRVQIGWGLLVGLDSVIVFKSLGCECVGSGIDKFVQQEVIASGGVTQHRRQKVTIVYVSVGRFRITRS